VSFRDPAWRRGPPLLRTFGDPEPGRGSIKENAKVRRLSSHSQSGRARAQGGKLGSVTKPLVNSTGAGRYDIGEGRLRVIIIGL